MRPIRCFPLAAVAIAAWMLAGAPSESAAQCCGSVCADADDDGQADDLVACGPLVLDGVTSATLTGCQEVPGAACVGGQLILGGEVLNGCGCLLGNCVDGGLGTLDAGACTQAAVAGCIAGGNTVEELDSASCEVCGNGVCGAGEDLTNCLEDCGCANHVCGGPRSTGPAPGGCFCDADCGGAGDCCPDACDVCSIECSS